MLEWMLIGAAMAAGEAAAASPTPDISSELLEFLADWDLREALPAALPPAEPPVAAGEPSSEPREHAP